MKRSLLLVLIGIFSAAFCVSAFLLISYWRESAQQADFYEEIAAQIDSSDDTADPNARHPDYSALAAQNPDMIGWIRIEGSRIDYPVMQTPSEPDYYLHHAFDRSYSVYGCPYVQANCNIGTSDNVVIYGHHMKDGSMFAGLCRYADESFYLEHRIIQFDTLDDARDFEVIAAFKTTANVGQGFPFWQFTDAADAAAFDEYVTSCKAISLYDTGVSAIYGDRLITLSTCEYSRANGRMVIVAKQIV